MENENDNFFQLKKPILDIDLLETIKRDDLFENKDLEKKYINQIIQEEDNLDNSLENNLNNIYEKEVINKGNSQNSPNINHKRFKSSYSPIFNKQKNILANFNFIDTKLKKYKPKYKQNLNIKTNDPYTRLSQNKHYHVEKTIQYNNRGINKLQNSYDLNPQNKTINIKNKSNIQRKKTDNKNIKYSILNNQKNNKNILSKIDKPLNQKNNQINNSNYTLNNLKSTSPITPKFNRSFNENIIYQNKDLSNENENIFDNLYEYNNINNNLKEYNKEEDYNKYHNKNNITPDTSYASNSNYIMKNKENNFGNKQNFYNINNNNNNYNININNQNPYFYNINEYYQPSQNNNNYNFNTSKKILKKSSSTDKIFQKKMINKYDNTKTNLIENQNNGKVKESRNKQNFIEDLNKLKLNDYQNEEIKSYSKPNIIKKKFNNNNFLLFNNDNENESQINYLMKKKNELESMNYNKQQKQQFFIERNINKDRNRKKSVDEINYINNNYNQFNERNYNNNIFY